VGKSLGFIRNRNTTTKNAGPATVFKIRDGKRIKKSPGGERCAKKKKVAAGRICVNSEKKKRKNKRKKKKKRRGGATLGGR